MTLTPGARLGAFEIVGSLGAGGMGVVYRARDTRLQRDVALKILPDAFAGDGERFARFTREAHILAAINHPNIAAIYGIEEFSDGGAPTTALVMELVDGEDLAERLTRGPLFQGEALGVARQLAEALGAAHEQGIIHRDLKPANIRIRPDGVVKVLDFGLAKAAAAPAAAKTALDHSPTITSPALTALGMILGTAAYMSPEQAKGQPADKRSDIWAFGCVLFEMLSGKRAFHGEDVAETLAAVLRADVPLDSLPTTTPSSVRRALAGCLERDRRRRFADFAVIAYLLDEPREPLATAPRRAVLQSAIVAAVGLAAGAAITLGLIGTRMAPTAPRVVRFSVPLTATENFTNLRSQVIAVSPDGAQLAYTRSGLILRNLADADGRRIDAAVNPLSPVFSPDGSEIAFYADGALHRLPVVGGGRATRICTLAEPPLGLVWVGSDLMIGGGTLGILRVAATGGTPVPIVAVGPNESAVSPEPLPGGRVVLFASPSGPADIQQRPGRILAYSLETGETKTIIDNGTTPRYVGSGHLVYANGGTLYAVSFDAVRLQITGTPVVVVEGVLQSLNTPVAQFALSDTGTLVYVPGVTSNSARTELAILDEKGAIKTLTLPPGSYDHPRVSPDATQVAFSFDDGRELNVFVAPIAGDVAPRRLTFNGRNRFPVWSHDGQRIIFQSDRDGDTALFSQLADGTRAAERLTKPEPSVSQVPESYSPDGSTLLFTRTTGVNVALWSLTLKTAAAEPFGDITSSVPINAAFSPDGRWVAYTTLQRSMFGLYVQPFPPTGGQFQVSSGRGIFPAWAGDGRELYFSFPGQLMKATVTTRPTFAVRATVPVPAVRIRQVWPGQRSYDAFGEGRLMSVVRPQDLQIGKLDQQINVVLNWVHEVTDRVR